MYKDAHAADSILLTLKKYKYSRVIPNKTIVHRIPRAPAIDANSAIPHFLISCDQKVKEYHKVKQYIAAEQIYKIFLERLKWRFKEIRWKHPTRADNTEYPQQRLPYGAHNNYTFILT
jgi:hypothetical protein